MLFIVFHCFDLILMVIGVSGGLKRDRSMLAFFELLRVGEKICKVGCIVAPEVKRKVFCFIFGTIQI